MDSLKIIGYSGHSYLCIEIAKQMGYEVKFYYDNESKKNNPYNLIFSGSEDKLQETISNVFISIGDNFIREKVYKKLKSLENITFKNLIHSNCFISSSAILGENCLVSTGVQINPMSKIGDNIIINTNTVIEHECIINNHTHIAPGSVLLGNVKIGEKCFIGANSTIKQGITLCDNVIVGAGSVVLNDINKPGTYVGVPAKLITKK